MEALIALAGAVCLGAFGYLWVKVDRIDASICEVRITLGRMEERLHTH